MVAKALALQSRENLQREITRREAERNTLELTLLKAVAFKKMNEIDVLRQERKEVERLVDEQQQSKIRMERKFLNEIKFLQEENQFDFRSHIVIMRRSNLQHKTEKDEWNDSNVRAINLASTKFKEMESEVKRELLEKELLMDLTRKRDEADRLQLKEAHKLECDALKSEIQGLRAQAEGHAKAVPLDQSYIQGEGVDNGSY